jgi:hypothetical protein
MLQWSDAGMVAPKPPRRVHMRKIILSRNSFWIALSSALCFAMPVLAMDPTCQSMLAVQSSLKNKAFHIYMTTENKYASATFSKAAASIGLAGVKKSEEIWTGKDVYVLNRGKWIDMHTSFAEMSGTDQDDPDVKKVREAVQCKTLPDVTAFGQAATVYQQHNPEAGGDTKIWVSKGSHLPIKFETTTTAGPMRSFTSARYDYANVQAPANTISMSDMMKK